jgi:ketosteroid isomerase-like protein
VTDPDIALCLAMLERTNAEDIDGLLSYCHEDIECEPFLAQVEGSAFTGHEGMRRWWEERTAAWETIKIEPGKIRRMGSHLLMDGVFHTRARGSGVEISVPFAQGAHVRDGKVAWWGVYSTEQEAIDRLRERDPSL